MLGALGSSALIVALGISVLGFLAAAYGGYSEDASWIRGAYAAVYTNFALLSIATLSMTRRGRLKPSFMVSASKLAWTRARRWW